MIEEGAEKTDWENQSEAVSSGYEELQHLQTHRTPSSCDCLYRVDQPLNILCHFKESVKYTGKGYNCL